MLHWIEEHRALLTWLTAASAVLFIGSLVVVPGLVVRIPADYFAREKRPPSAWAGRHAIVRLTMVLGKNALGCVFIAAGIAMLVLPGQGLLTILIGSLMIDFPGKYRFEKRLFSHPGVQAGINWLRKRAGREPLRVETPPAAQSAPREGAEAALGAPEKSAPDIERPP